MIIKENGKLYNIDEETGLVTEASSVETPEEVIEAEELRDELRIGDRVTVGQEEGTIVSIISSVYGPAFGVRFDDGGLDEYPEERLARVETPEPDYETPVKEVLSRYEVYETLPSYTRDEIEAKIAEARHLNLRAKALITDSKLAFSDQVELDRVVLATGTDLLDFKTLKDSAEANEEYLSGFQGAQFEMAPQFKNTASYGATDDASWVDSAFHDIEETTDADLAVTAQEMVNRLSVEQLNDAETVALSSSFQLETLVATDEQKEKFASYVQAAIEEKLGSTETIEDEVVDESLEDFDTSSFYL